MKRSDMERMLRSGLEMQSLIDSILDRMVIPWDPEEEPLPGKIGLYLGASSDFLSNKDDGTGRFWATLNTPNYDRIPMEHRRVIAREAVRRYNLWQELEELAAGWPRFIGTSRQLADKLRDILDKGKEGGGAL